MDKLKDRMYNFEVTPPADVWQGISAELDKGLVVPITKPKTTNKKLFFILSAAACIAVLLFSVVWFISSRKTQTPLSIVPGSNNNTVVATERIDTSEKISAPRKVEKTTADKNKTNDLLVKNNTSKKQSTKKLNNSSANDNDNDIVNDEPPNSYITIAGPEGQAVKVSSKVASLIESSDNNYPPKPVWNKKIDKWKDIMKANTLTPTTGNFLDIVDLTNSLKEK